MTKAPQNRGAHVEVEGLDTTAVESTDPGVHNPDDNLPDPFDGHDPWTAHPDVADWQPGGGPDE